MKVHMNDGQAFRRLSMVGKMITPLLCSATLLLTPALSSAQSYPSKSVRIVVVNAPGSSADVVARIVATRLGEKWKQPVIVDNKPGANGNLGMDIVAKSAPDGYTLGLAVPSVMTVNPFVYKNMPFKPLEDLVGVTQTTSIMFGLYANPALKLKSVQEVVTFAKTKPGGVNYSSAGVGNLGHLAGELFAGQAGLKMTHIPNKGDTPGLVDVMGGQTDIMFAPLPSAIGFVRGGKLTLVAVASRKRLASFPDVPTMIESGLPNMLIEGWTGIVAPAATPPAVIAEIEKTVNSVLEEQAVKTAIEAQGFDAVGTSSKEFNQLIKTESVKWGQVIDKAGIKLNE